MRFVAQGDKWQLSILFLAIFDLQLLILAPIRGEIVYLVVLST